MELFRTIGSTIQKLSTPQHVNFTVAPHLLSRYGMAVRFASHMPAYSTDGTECLKTLMLDGIFPEPPQ
ncbi:hypothetical protein TNCV_1852691 [Trichonephila clavipes]|nr:hypothetical protein TNCV_1852691 [Trichonephila clavipes]